MSRIRHRRAGVGLLASLLGFVLLSALFMGSVVVSRGVDSANRVVAIMIFVPLVSSSVIFAIGLYRALFAEHIAERRWSRINRQLGEMGFRDATANETANTLRLPVHLLAPYTLAPQRGGGIDHVTVGQLKEREVRCFNVRVRGGGWMDVNAVALRVEASFADTLIIPAKGPIPPRPGMKRIRFEHERFNRRVAVFSTDPFFASAMIDARMMAWLERELHRAVIELADRWVLAWCMPRHGRRGPGALVELLVGFDEQIPRALPSFFPKQHAQRLWQHRSSRT